MVVCTLSSPRPSSAITACKRRRLAWCVSSRSTSATVRPAAPSAARMTAGSSPGGPSHPPLPSLPTNHSPRPRGSERGADDGRQLARRPLPHALAVHLHELLAARERLGGERRQRAAAPHH